MEAPFPALKYQASLELSLHLRKGPGVDRHPLKLLATIALDRPIAAQDALLLAAC